MSDSRAGLRRKISSAGDLQTVVRTMKVMAASNIGQYEKSVQALNQYYHTIEMGLGACLRALDQQPTPATERKLSANDVVIAVVFGSDQGLVGTFNDVVADHVVGRLAKLPGKPRIWAVGERVWTRLVAANLPVEGHFDVPYSIKAIAPLVSRIQDASEVVPVPGHNSGLYTYHNRRRSGAGYDPVEQRLLPLDTAWQQTVSDVSWPTSVPPEIIGESINTLRSLIREFLFISIFRACAESLSSENASRLAAMERADKNIKDLMGELGTQFRSLRQNAIDEELFDVVAGYESFVG